MRSILPVTRRGLRESWRGILAWAIGLTGALALYLPLFPSFGSNGSLEEIIATLPPEMVEAMGYDQIGSGPGYAQGTFFGLIGFVLLVIAATSWGAAGIGGAEESGRLELDLAHGIGRVPYVLEVALAIGIRLGILGIVSGGVVALLNGPSELALSGEGITAGTIALIGLAAVSGAAALLGGALTGRRVVGVALGAGIAVYGYALQAVANQSDDLAWVETLSPYSWAYATSPLETGFSGGIAVLWALALVFVTGAMVSLRQRDITG
ncbi:ABC transporter permease subunit [Microbacterium koreense]|uniref:ABC transporter permease subunit n=1 Tax=Microbacterium koreense TaxID=323761 RepID=A0ABW2ZN67_9MICO